MTDNSKANKTQKHGFGKKIVMFGCLPLIGLFLLIIIAGSLVETNQGVASTSTDSTKVEESSPKNESTETSKAIPGLAPVDVYLNMENEGFETEKTFSSEFGNSWISKKTIEGIEYQVSVFSSETDNVESVKATAMIDPSIKSIIATQQFIMYVASLPFENAKPEETVQWVKNNFNKDKATKIVGDVKFTIYAPTKMVRMLTVERNRN